VIGIEMNPAQVAASRAGLPATGGGPRIEVIEADVLEYRPDRAFDVVYSVDSAMLIPDIPRLLAVAREALASDGRLEIVTIGAGPECDDSTRRFAWDVDGMSSLLSAVEWRELAAQAGFAGARADDITELAIEGSLRIDAGLARNREAITDAAGPAAYAGWVNVGAVYVEAFRAGRLSYLHVSGVRQKSAKPEKRAAGAGCYY
jgi:SAM-dependent methyltransferase